MNMNTNAQIQYFQCRQKPSPGLSILLNSQAEAKKTNLNGGLRVKNTLELL